MDNSQRDGEKAGCMRNQMDTKNVGNWLCGTRDQRRDKRTQTTDVGQWKTTKGKDEVDAADG